MSPQISNNNAVSDNYSDEYQDYGDTSANEDYWFDTSENPEQDDSFSENVESSETQLRRLSHGENVPAENDWLGEIDEIEDGVSQLDDPALDPVQAVRKMEELRAEVEKSQLPEIPKEDLISKIDDLIEKLKAGKLDDPSLIEELPLEFEKAMDDHPPFAKSMAEKLREIDVNTDAAEVEAALKKADLSEKDFATLDLKVEEDAKKMLDFLTEVNPEFADAMESDPEKGYGKKVLKQAQAMLKAVIPDAVDPNAAVSLIDQNGKVPWNVGEIKARYTGELVHYNGDYNNRFFNVGAFLDSYLVPLTKNQKSVGDLQAYLGAGWNYVDHGPHNKGLEIRRNLTAIFEYCRENAFLFRNMMRQLPEQALIEMKNLLAYRGDGGLADDTKRSGDRWNTIETMVILDWLVMGGPPPAELGTENSSSSGTPSS